MCAVIHQHLLTFEPQVFRQVEEHLTKDTVYQLTASADEHLMGEWVSQQMIVTQWIDAVCITSICCSLLIH